MVELIVNLLLLACGIAIGYFWRKPAPTGVREVVRLEYVDRPVVVKEPELRVEYIDKPVIVEKPTLQIERVEVPYVVEKTVVERVPEVKVVDRPIVQVERIAVPSGSASVALPTPVASVRVVFMDANETRITAIGTMDARGRKPTIERKGVKYTCSRQDAQGDWIYRQVAS